MKERRIIQIGKNQLPEIITEDLLNNLTNEEMNLGKKTDDSWLIKADRDIYDSLNRIEVIAINQLLNAANIRGYETVMITKNPA